MNLRFVGKTIDTGSDCFELRHGHSWLAGVVDKEDKRLIIHHVSSTQRGHFKEMMDYLVQQTGLDRILFTSVLNNNLRKRLIWFEEKQIYFEAAQEYMDCLEGTWFKKAPQP